MITSCPPDKGVYAPGAKVPEGFDSSEAKPAAEFRTSIPVRKTICDGYAPAVPKLSVVGIMLSGLSTENGITSLSATVPHITRLIHRGAFLNSARNTITASTTHDAAMFMLRSLRKTSVIIFSLLSESVDHILYFVNLRAAQPSLLGESGDERRERSAESLLDKLVYLRRADLVL